jgi:hypothetical protein
VPQGISDTYIAACRRSILFGVTHRLSGGPLHPVVRAARDRSQGPNDTPLISAMERVFSSPTALDYGGTAFRNRSVSEIQPSAISALRSEAS